MTTVKDVIMNVNYDDVIAALRVRYDSEDDPFFVSDCRAYMIAMLRARDIEPVTNPKCIMFATPAYTDGKEYVSAHLILKSDIADFAAGRESPRDEHTILPNCWNWVGDELDGVEPSVDMPVEVVDKICGCGWHIASYAYDLDEWSVILGYEVDMLSVEKYGAAAFISDVLQEMTFYSADEDVRREKADELSSRLDAVDRAVETGDMSDFVTLDEFIEGLEDSLDEEPDEGPENSRGEGFYTGFFYRDDRTEEEKEAERRQDDLELAFSILALRNVISEYVRHNK